MRYMPILRVQEGEYLSLRDLHDDIAAAIAPLMYQTPAFDEDDPAAKAQDRLNKLMRNWDGSGFYDPALIAAWQGVDTTPLYHAACRDGPFAPAVPFDQGIPVPREAAQARDAAAIRLTDPYALIRPTLAQELDRYLDSLGLTPQQTTIVLDLADADSAAAFSAISGLPRYTEWASVVVAAGSLVPVTSPATTSTLPRAHLANYQQAAPHASSHLVFGDYGILEGTYGPPATYAPAAKLVYTEPAEWFYTRGRSTALYGHEQIYRLAADITARHYWRTENYSWGDAWIAQHAQGHGSPGNAATWIRVALTHHLSHVVREDV
jgi:hypothetical protein